MIETKNFFLQLFEGMDKFDYKVINENWQRIDDALNELLNGGDSVILPTMTVDKIENGYRITTHDVKGSQSFEIFNGKDAYQYALDGGYTGTEEEFAAELAARMEISISEEINQWLDKHPEATTTVQDGSIEEIKFTDELKLKTIKDYVTPQMFGASGTGTTNDTNAINAALEEAGRTGKAVYFPSGKYIVKSTLIVPNNITLCGNCEKSIISTEVANGYVLNGISSNGTISDTLVRVNIQSLYFENGLSTDSTTKLKSGDFIGIARGLYMTNCRVNGYYKVFAALKDVCRLIGNRFTTIYDNFVADAIDSIIIGNYINASVYGMPYGSKCFYYQFSAMTFSNNFVDYFHDAFAVKNFYQSVITNNTFSRCLNVFHDSLGSVTISNNSFSYIRYVASDWSKLTSEQVAKLSTEKWSVIKFDNEVVNDSHMMFHVIFTDNVSTTCDNYIYVADGVTILTGHCNFKGNKINNGYKHSLVEVGFRNWSTTEEAYNSFKDVYFDFWDMREYDSLPSPTLYGNNAKSVVSFPYMKAIYNNELYINVDGVWKKPSMETVS